VLPAGSKLLETGIFLRHIYSHIRLDYLPLLIAVERDALRLEEHDEYRWLQGGHLKEFALHGAHQKIINTEPTCRWFNS